MKHFVTILILAALMAVPLMAIDTEQTELSDSQVYEILYLFEEEKLARDLYAVLGEEWNLRIFNNITRSEETHRSQVQDIADDYNLDYTILPSGVFALPEIQALYDELLAAGLEGRTEALEVGRTVEIVDIEDLDNMLDGNYPEDVVLVLERLSAGSENHLAAFNRQIDR